MRGLRLTMLRIAQVGQGGAGVRPWSGGTRNVCGGVAAVLARGIDLRCHCVVANSNISKCPRKQGDSW